jgi:hypothetical protein
MSKKQALTVLAAAQDVPSWLPKPKRGVQVSGLRPALAWLFAIPTRHAAVIELSAMSDRMLADVGLSRADVQTVVRRDFAARGRAA